jgi:hypothetical protein
MNCLGGSPATKTPNRAESDGWVSDKGIARGADYPVIVQPRVRTLYPDSRDLVSGTETQSGFRHSRTM